MARRVLPHAAASLTPRAAWWPSALTLCALSTPTVSALTKHTRSPPPSLGAPPPPPPLHTHPQPTRTQPPHAPGFKQVFDLDTTIDAVEHHGSTDPLIILKVLEHHGIPRARVRGWRAAPSMCASGRASTARCCCCTRCCAARVHALGAAARPAWPLDHSAGLARAQGGAGCHAGPL
jgi:hypothetical protein